MALRRSQRGAALVEGAIIFLPLCMIMFGIIEYGFVFKDTLTLSSATRTGARLASAEPQEPSFILDTVNATKRAAIAGKFTTDDRMWIYKATDDGQPVDGCPSSTCAVYRYTAAKTWVFDSGSWDYRTHNACLGSTIDKVAVRLTLHHKSISGWFPDLTLRDQTTMQLEPLDANCD